jgi:hypothetical protein
MTQKKIKKLDLNVLFFFEILALERYENQNSDQVFVDTTNDTVIS